MRIWIPITQCTGYILLLFCLVMCRPQTPFEGFQKGETGRVVHVLNGDSLALNTGLVVRLSCISAPRAGTNSAKESSRHLEDLVQGRDVILYYNGLTRDKFGRALAQIVTQDNLGPHFWVNQTLIRNGTVWFDVFPDTAKGCANLRAEEALARKEKIGLWKKRDFGPSDISICCESPKTVWVKGELQSFNTEQKYELEKCVLNFKNAETPVIYPGACDMNKTAIGKMFFVRGYFTGEVVDARHVLNVQSE